MNAMGDDYYTESYGPARKSWLSGNMAQLTVLLTGIILTVTAYAILNILIQQMLNDERDSVIESARKSVSESIFDLEEAINASAAILSLSQGQTESAIHDNVLSAVPRLAFFDRVFWRQRNVGPRMAYVHTQHAGQ